MELVIAVQIKKKKTTTTNQSQQSSQTRVNLQFRVFYTISSWQHFQTKHFLIYPDMLNE